MKATKVKVMNLDEGLEEALKVYTKARATLESATKKYNDARLEYAKLNNENAVALNKLKTVAQKTNNYKNRLYRIDGKLVGITFINDQLVVVDFSENEEA